MSNGWGGRREGSGRKGGEKALATRIRLAQMKKELALQTCPPQEVEVRERLAILNEVFVLYETLVSVAEFPDLVIVTRTGEQLRAEVETRSSNFRRHRHDVRQCDIIICWEHDWADCPLPVLSIAGLWAAYMQLKPLGFWYRRAC